MGPGIAACIALAATGLLLSSGSQGDFATFGWILVAVGALGALVNLGIRRIGRRPPR